MAALQVPELSYDLGSDEPVQIDSPSELTRPEFKHSTFVSVAGRIDLDRRIEYASHGVPATYFLLEDYGDRLVVRTYERIESPEEWSRINRFVGRLRPIGRLPFRRGVRARFEAEYDVRIPPDAYFLGLYDVPELSGWQVGAAAFVAVLWLVLFYLFFIRRWDRPGAADGPKRRDASGAADLLPPQADAS
jgi:hypothetical protein